jgi:hypothetical protein
VVLTDRCCSSSPAPLQSLGWLAQPQIPNKLLISLSVRYS